MSIPDTARTVTVGCKLPNGLVLSLQREGVEHEPLFGGGTREVKVFRNYGKQVALNGFALKANSAPKHLVMGGYGLTPNVDAEFMKEWLEQFKETKFVQDQIIIVHAAKSDMAANARDGEKIMSGLEPIDPLNLPIKEVKLHQRPS
jgi:hypothetical protein